MKGGYQIIKLTKALEGNGEVTIPGIYNAFNSSQKVILLENIVIDTTKHKSTFIAPEVSGSNFVFILYGHSVVVDIGDSVTCAVID